jgi:hypothetical protein
MRFRTLRGLIAAAGLGSAILLGGCGGSSSLSAESNCKDFMNASAVEQHEVIDQLASRYQKPDYSTPLGEPEVAYYCAASPSTTLGDFFEKAQD